MEYRLGLAYVWTPPRNSSQVSVPSERTLDGNVWEHFATWASQYRRHINEARFPISEQPVSGHVRFSTKHLPTAYLGKPRCISKSTHEHPGTRANQGTAHPTSENTWLLGRAHQGVAPNQELRSEECRERRGQEPANRHAITIAKKQQTNCKARGHSGQPGISSPCRIYPGYIAECPHLEWWFFGRIHQAVMWCQTK